MTRTDEAARRVASRLSPMAAVDPNIAALLAAVVAELVRRLRDCYPTADGAFAYLTRDFGPFLFWRRATRDRLIDEAIVETVAVESIEYGYRADPTALRVALRSAIRDDLSRGLLADLYRETR